MKVLWSLAQAGASNPLSWSSSSLLEKVALSLLLVVVFLGLGAVWRLWQLSRQSRQILERLKALEKSQARVEKSLRRLVGSHRNSWWQELTTQQQRDLQELMSEASQLLEQPEIPNSPLVEGARDGY